MTEQRMKTALTGLQWTLGLVILIEAVLFVRLSAAHDFAQTHMPDIVRLVLGWGRDYWRAALTDSANGGARRMGAGGDFCFGDCHSLAAWGLQRGESPYIHSGGLGGCERQDRHGEGRVAGMVPFKALLVEGASGVGKSTLIDVLIRRHVDSAKPRRAEA
jgi:hypothetical protein